jgi:hypothetical protein
VLDDELAPELVLNVALVAEEVDEDAVPELLVEVLLEEVLLDEVVVDEVLLDDAVLVDALDDPLEAVVPLNDMLDPEALLDALPDAVVVGVPLEEDPELAVSELAREPLDDVVLLPKVDARDDEFPPEELEVVCAPLLEEVGEPSVELVEELALLPLGFCETPEEPHAMQPSTTATTPARPKYMMCSGDRYPIHNSPSVYKSF